MTAALIAVDSELRFEAANNLGQELFSELTALPKGNDTQISSAATSRLCHPQIERYYQQTYDQE